MFFVFIPTFMDSTGKFNISEGPFWFAFTFNFSPLFTRRDIKLNINPQCTMEKVIMINFLLEQGVAFI